ncbi:MAG TPA: F0F1 ATP synthase subunit delta [Bacilli bacterium]|nr:F0F1 ATP synthase subunit delta [Bacilli bacterium]
MKTSPVAKRYAEALYDVAKEKGLLEAVEKDLAGVAGALADHPQLANILVHPNISLDAKKQQIKDLFAGRVSDVVLNFLLVLFDARRQGEIGNVYNEFVRLADAARGVVKAEVETAVSLTEEELNSIKEKLSANGKQVDVKMTVNPALIGGAKVRLGDQVLDYSVAGQLASFRQSLQQESVR